MSGCQLRKSLENSSLRALHGPAFHPPVVALEQTDEIEQRAAAHRIVHDMAAGPDPVGADVHLDAGRHAIARHQHAPGDDAGELRPVGAEHRKPHARLHAVGADDDGRRAGSPRSNSMLTESLVLRDADALAVEMDRVRPLAPDRVEQHARADRRGGTSCRESRSARPTPRRDRTASRSGRCSRAGSPCRRRRRRAARPLRRAPAHRARACRSS